MDVTGITSGLNNFYPKLNADLQLSEAKSDSFQSTLDAALKAQDKDEIKKSCKEFESYFMHMMFKEMRKTLHPEDGIFAPSRAEEYFQDMLDGENTKAMAESGGIGLADMMYKQLMMQVNNTEIDNGINAKIM